MFALPHSLAHFNFVSIHELVCVVLVYLLVRVKLYLNLYWSVLKNFLCYLALGVTESLPSSLKLKITFMVVDSFRLLKLKLINTSKGFYLLQML